MSALRQLGHSQIRGYGMFGSFPSRSMSLIFWAKGELYAPGYRPNEVGSPP
jgi:hypothetical protein